VFLTAAEWFDVGCFGDRLLGLIDGRSILCGFGSYRLTASGFLGRSSEGHSSQSTTLEGIPEQECADREAANAKAPIAAG